MLSDYRVLDLADDKGVYCAKVLADLGADVIKIEPPGGDPSRNIGPFYKDIPDPEKSLCWWAYNTSKRGITLSIETADGQDIFKRLVKTADVVVESYPPEEVMTLLQEAGVAAGAVESGADLLADPQLNHRGTLVILEHPEIGPHIYQPPPYRLSKTPHELTMPAPCLGQHNEYILKEVLGMSDDEVADLLIAGALE